MNDENLLRFKKCCLYRKQVIFDNGIIQIGTVTSSLTSETGDYMKLSLFIGNMKESLIESIYINYIFLKDLSISIKDKLPPIMEKGMQIKQDLMLQYTMIPYQILFNKLNYKYGFNSYELLFAMPITFNKFLQVRYIEKEQFQNEWKIYKNNALYSNFIQVEDKLIRNGIHEFKTYFNNLIDLKPWNLSYYQVGIGDYKLAGSFKFGEEGFEKAIWLKITMTPKKEVAFSVFCELDNIQEYFLNTLMFLFKKGA